MQCLLYLGLLRRRRVQIAVTPQHFRIRPRFNLLLDGLGLLNGTNHLIARRVAKHFSNNIWIQAIVLKQAVLATN